MAALEALLALHDLAGDRVELTVLSPQSEFVYRPMAVAEPFGRGSAAHHELTRIVADVDARLVDGALTEVDGDARTAITASGERLSYDALLVAVGAGSEPAFHRVLTWTPEIGPELFSGLLRDLEEGIRQERGVHRAAGGGVGAAGLRAGADDRVAGVGDGPG